MPNLRRDNTSAGFISGNPVLAAGEHGYETDTEASKIGDGVTPWADLPYTGANPTYATLNPTFAKPYSNSFIALGDSITASVLPYNGPSFAVLAPLLLKQALRPIRNAGIGGQTSAQMLARIQTDVLAYGPNYVSLCAGANDIAQSVPFATYRANVVAMVNAIRATGATVILCTVPPRSDSATFALTAAIWSEWVRMFAQATPGVMLVDFNKATADPNNSNQWLSGYGAADGVHPTAAGSLAMAQEFANTVSPRLNTPSVAPTYAVYYSVASALNLIRNGNMLDISAVDGIPDGWQFSPSTAPSGSTRVVAATDSRFIGTPIKFTFANPAAADGIKTSGAGITTGWAVGDRLRFVGKIAIDSPAGISAGGKGAYVQLDFSGSGVQTVIQNVPNPINDGVFQGDFVVPAGTTAIYPGVGANFSTTGSGSVLFGQLGLYNLTALGL
jgi:lysophospholipase L1-like esterase